MNAKTTFVFDGYVYPYGDARRGGRFKAGTEAVSKAQAATNIKSQFRAKYNIAKSVPLTLVGDVKPAA